LASQRNKPVVDIWKKIDSALQKEAAEKVEAKLKKEPNKVPNVGLDKRLKSIKSTASWDSPRKRIKDLQTYTEFLEDKYPNPSTIDKGIIANSLKTYYNILNSIP
jgi:hypothetical protein